MVVVVLLLLLVMMVTVMMVTMVTVMMGVVLMSPWHGGETWATSWARALLPPSAQGRGSQEE